MRRATVSIVGKCLARNINIPAHEQKIPFWKCPGDFPLKNTEQHTWKTLTDLVETFIKCNFTLFKLP